MSLANKWMRKKMSSCSNSALLFLGVVEKGFIDISLTVNGDPGHSSSPPKETTIGILGQLIYEFPTTFLEISRTSFFLCLYWFLICQNGHKFLEISTAR